VLALDWILYFSSTQAMATGQACWQYQSNRGFWRDMPEEYSLLHEAVFDEGIFKFQFNTPFGGGTKKYDYKVYLDSFWQLNESFYFIISLWGEVGMGGLTNKYILIFIRIFIYT
jgi:hypothetical protein